MLDLGFVTAMVVSAVLILVGLSVSYGVVLDSNRTVIEFRRIQAWVLTQFPWPSATALAGFFPAG